MKVKTKMHGKWCRRFIGTGVDIQSRREISEVVMEEGRGGGGNHRQEAAPWKRISTGYSGLSW